MRAAPLFLGIFEQTKENKAVCYPTSEAYELLFHCTYEEPILHNRDDQGAVVLIDSFDHVIPEYLQGPASRYLFPCASVFKGYAVLRFFDIPAVYCLIEHFQFLL